MSVMQRDWLSEHYSMRGVEKRTFATFREAQAEADKVNRREGEKRPMLAYKCGYCDGFHLGHSNPNKRRRGR